MQCGENCLWQVHRYGRHLLPLICHDFNNFKYTLLEVQENIACDGTVIDPGFELS